MRRRPSDRRSSATTKAGLPAPRSAARGSSSGSSRRDEADRRNASAVNQVRAAWASGQAGSWGISGALEGARFPEKIEQAQNAFGKRRDSGGQVRSREERGIARLVAVWARR